MLADNARQTENMDTILYHREQKTDTTFNSCTRRMPVRESVKMNLNNQTQIPLWAAINPPMLKVQILSKEGEGQQ